MTRPSSLVPSWTRSLGAYVLDALEPDERALVEDYLDTHPRARAEVDELRETTAVLAGAPVGDTTAPAELWARIAAEVEAGDDAAARADAADELATRRAAQGRPRPRCGSLPRSPRPRSVLVALLAAQVVSLNDELDDERNPANVAAAFDRATDSRRCTPGGPRGPGRHQLARVVMLPDGTGYLVNENMEPLSADETYQLWAIVGEGEAAARDLGRRARCRSTGRAVQGRRPGHGAGVDRRELAGCARDRQRSGRDREVRLIGALVH